MLDEKLTNSQGNQVSVATVLKYIDKRLIDIERTISGAGIAIIGADGQPSRETTDLGREAAWNRRNFRDLGARLDRIEQLLEEVTK